MKIILNKTKNLCTIIYCKAAGSTILITTLEVNLKSENKIAIRFDSRITLIRITRLIFFLFFLNFCFKYFYLIK